MIFLYLVEELLAFLFIITMLTQVTWPILTDRPTFPIFRGWRKAQQTISDLNDEEETLYVKKAIAERRAKLDKENQA